MSQKPEIVTRTTPGVNAGVNRKNGKIFCKRVIRCGYCGNLFGKGWKVGRVSCPQCFSRMVES